MRVALPAARGRRALGPSPRGVLELPPGVTRLYIARDGDAEGTGRRTRSAIGGTGRHPRGARPLSLPR